MGSFISKIFHYKKIVSAKRSSTLSGALVYFTLLELVPLAYLTTLTLSIFGAKFSNPINNLMTREMNTVVDYIFVTANNLGASGNVFAVLISTYSATHFFFHLRRTGEMVYNYKSQSNVVIRIASVGIMICVLFLFALLQGVYFIISKISIQFFGKILGRVINYSALFLMLFIFILVLNIYACPYKTKIKEVFVGSLYTCLFCVITTVLFFVYVKYFTSYDKIYGKIAIIVVFLMWLYILMKGVIGGMNLNVYLMGRRRNKKNKLLSKRALKNK